MAVPGQLFTSKRSCSSAFMPTFIRRHSSPLRTFVLSFLTEEDKVDCCLILQLRMRVRHWYRGFPHLAVLDPHTGPMQSV